MDLRPIGHGFSITAPNSPSNCLYKTLPPFIPGRAYSFLPPYQRFELLRAANPTKGKGRIGHSVGLCRRRLLLVVVSCVAGPLDLLSRPDRRIALQDTRDGLQRPYNIAQVKPYLSEVEVSNAFLVDIQKGLGSYSTHEPNDVHLTEVLKPNYPRASSFRMTKAKGAEIMGLLDRRTFKVVLREEIPPNGHVLPGRFVLSIKSTEFGDEEFKARYVIGGHRDRHKEFMVHTSQILQPASVRLMLVIASIFNFEVWTSDVRQAYLQSAEPLSRAIYIDPPSPKFSLAPEECLQLMKPLYGLCKSGDLWHATLDRHHRQDLGMKSLDTDPTLYHLVSDGTLFGLSGSYVDDMIRCGTQEFRRHCLSTNNRFDMADDEILPCTFTGFRLSCDSHHSF